MTLHDRIMSMCAPDNVVSHPLCMGGYSVAQQRAAHLAKEADELMAEMAESLEELRDYDRNDKSAALSAHKSILESLDNYNTYKERRQ